MQAYPRGMLRHLASVYGIDKQCRTFSAWNHVVSLLYAQLTHAIGLNDLCDSLRHHSAKLLAVRGAILPSRNGLSHTNKIRNPQLMEDLFWKMLADPSSPTFPLRPFRPLQGITSTFQEDRQYPDHGNCRTRLGSSHGYGDFRDG